MIAGLPERVAATEKALLARWPDTLVDPSLDRITALLDRLGNPQRDVTAIHVTGTNGKTTTARMIDGVLRASGRRTGRFSGPHLRSVRERIVIDGTPIDETELVTLHETVLPDVEAVDRESETPLSFFEVVTAMALLAFDRAGLDVVVVETGLGGTWDATNVLDARLAVVTPIALDHTEYLGADVATIAGENAGVIKPGGVAIVANQTAKARSVIDAHAAAVGADVRSAAGPRRRTSVTLRPLGQTVHLTVGGRTFPDLFLPLLGAYQAENAQLALAAVEAFLAPGGHALTAQDAHRGLAAVRAPGRLEQVRGSPPVLVDASSNPAGMRATLEGLCGALDVTRLVVVLGLLRSKDAPGILEALDPIASEVVVTETRSPRALPAAELAAAAVPILGPARVATRPRIADAITSALGSATDPFLPAAVLVTGGAGVAAVAQSLLTRPDPS